MIGSPTSEWLRRPEGNFIASRAFFIGRPLTNGWCGERVLAGPADAESPHSGEAFSCFALAPSCGRLAVEDIMSVGRICVREVDIAESDESVQAAAQRMHARKVGTLVVVDPARAPIGIVTDRDLAVRIVGEARDSGQTTVGEVMTRLPRTIHEDTPIEEALRAMRVGTFRRLPVVD